MLISNEKIFLTFHIFIQNARKKIPYKNRVFHMKHHFQVQKKDDVVKFHRKIWTYTCIFHMKLFSKKYKHIFHKKKTYLIGFHMKFRCCSRYKNVAYKILCWKNESPFHMKKWLTWVCFIWKMFHMKKMLFQMKNEKNHVGFQD